MNEQEAAAFFAPLYSDLADEKDFPATRPLLAHYTSLATLEKILETDELWFSNPLVMNDLEEVRFGIVRGAEIFHINPLIAAACRTTERHTKLREAFTNYFRRFDDEHSFDTYVFCWSRHDPRDDDGLLSMWRGYGGNGTGAALVIDTSKVEVMETSPLIVSRVHYASTSERIAWLDSLMQRFSSLLAATDIPTELLYVPAYHLFERIKMFALFSKHFGFREEDEWRVVYIPSRDPGRKLVPMFNYSLGQRGAELRLRYKVGHVPGISPKGLSLETLVDRIILGPSISGSLAVRAVQRMLEKVGKTNLKERIRASSIPFRP